MTRKLLPYEYDLIDALGVSKEDYLDFVAQQHIYEDVKEGTTLDARNEITAVILFVVGLLLQAASILLAPKPPEQKGTAQTRDQRLSPRTGFNGAQELAVYGETVPLVYTSMRQNPNGGVRVSTLLLWSAILSFGNSQFMRLMMTVAASRIGSIDPERTAIGQLPAKDIVLSNVWQYFNADGPTTYSNLIQGSQQDPTRAGATSTDTTAKLNGLPARAEGFSQCFSPTTANAISVTGFIPINAEVITLNEDGDRVRTLVGVQYTPRPSTFAVGTRISVTVPNTIDRPLTTDTPANARQDALRAAASLINNGAIFKMGSALFRVAESSYSNNGSDIEEGNLTVVMECIRAGNKFTIGYDTRHWLSAGGSLQTQTDRRIAELNRRIEGTGGLGEFGLQLFGQGSINPRIAHLQRILTQGYYKRLNSSRGVQRPVTEIRLTTEDRTRIQRAINDLEAERTTILGQIEDLNNQLVSIAVAPFHTKGLARIEQAAYASVTQCNVLDLVIKYEVYRRISGRNNVYGKRQKSYQHSPSDNGAKARTAMFRVEYRFNNTGNYARVPFIFCTRGINEQSVFTYLKLVCFNDFSRAKQFIEVRLEPVVDPPAEPDVNGYCYLNPSGNLQTLTAAETADPRLRIVFNGSKHGRSTYPPNNKSPKDTSEFDLFNYDSFTSSTFAFDGSPEIKITAVNEQTIENWASYSPALYRGLSNFALHVNSGPGTQDVRDISTWVQEGKLLRLLSTATNAYGNEAIGTTDDVAVAALTNATPTASSSFAPDIFLDTVLDGTNGIGRYASLHSVDVMQLAQSKRFCQHNRLFMDGVIADQRSWRDFWSQVAPFSLLELGKIGGKETLVPALPYVRSTGAITRAISITALFNQGNILDDSFKEEFIDYGASVQDVIVTLIYRDVERNGIFPRNNSVEVKRTDTQDANAIRESLDISQFVTTRAQAILLGKYLCQVRRFNRRAIEFKTFPTDSFVMPGSYVYVETSNNQWDGIYTGRIETGGVLNVPIASTIRNGTYNVLTYGSTDGTRSFTNVQVTNGVAASLSPQAGQLFVLGQAVRNKRVFRVTEVSMEEEGETTIRAVEHPCDTNGLSLIAQGLDAYVAGLFTIDGRAE
jgi:hypothetical protein